MDQSALRQLLHLVQNGECPIDNALEKLRHFPLENIQDACLDHQRSLRTGMPEVIYGASKSAEQIIAIAQALLLHSGPVLATRVDPVKAQTVTAEIPDLRYHPTARMLIGKAQAPRENTLPGDITLVCAGSSDIPVAEEAVLTLESIGNAVNRIYDVGVAGLHRLFAHRPLLDRSSVIIAVAGMEGALPGVIAGLVQCPVIGVPTSVGYGTSFGGVAALLGMLNSCAPGLAVVNIDNGFGAACMAYAIAMQKNR